MLTTIAAAILILWLLGFITNIGGFVHVLLVIALLLFVFDFLAGRRGA